jgi:hypothetical protein
VFASVNEQIFLLSKSPSENEDKMFFFIGELFDYCIGEGLPSNVFMGVGLVFSNG